MATLTEVGVFYPCATKGYEIPVDDAELTMKSGDVLEAQWVADGDISTRAAFDIIVDVLKMKEEYPYFVWHGLKVETRRITVQFSIAPEGQTASPALIVGLVWQLVWAIGALASILLLAYAIYIGIEREYLLPSKPPQGDALVWANDGTNDVSLPNVKVSVGSQIKTTGPNGEAVLFEDLLAGQHTFFGEILENYHAPDPIEATVKDQEQITVKINYFDVSQPLPENGYVMVYTEPVTGEVEIGGVPYGPAPVGPITLPAGDTVAISYSYVEGYITPPVDIFTVPRDDTHIAVGRYKLPEYVEGPWYEKYLKYGLVGGGILIGALIVIPEIIRSIPRRTKEKR